MGSADLGVRSAGEAVRIPARLPDFGETSFLIGFTLLVTALAIAGFVLG